MKELDKVLNQEEKVLWEGTPKFWPFVLSGSLISAAFGFFWMAMMVVMLILSPASFRWIVLLTPHFWIGPLLVFGPTIYNILVFKHTYYTITDKRVIFQSGIIGRDFKIIDFDQVTNAEVNVGLLDNLFGGNTGSLTISSAGVAYAGGNSRIRPYVFRNIINPYEIFKFFKKVSHDVKTDIEYPNKLRPSENPGYQTDYEPKK